MGYLKTEIQSIIKMIKNSLSNRQNHRKQMIIDYHSSKGMTSSDPFMTSRGHNSTKIF